MAPCRVMVTGARGLGCVFLKLVSAVCPHGLQGGQAAALGPPPAHWPLSALSGHTREAALSSVAHGTDRLTREMEILALLFT